MNDKHPRLVGFDVIRLISFFIITFYHFLYAVWRERFNDMNAAMVHEPLFWNGIYPALRSLSFSGHTILFMSSMLIALARKSFTQTLRLGVFLLLAWTLFVWSDYNFRKFEPFWDVHVLLFLGLVTISLAETLSPKLVLALGAVGFGATWISFYQMPFFQTLPVALRSPLIGDCAADAASWPILPWLGFLWSGYALGVFLRANRERFTALAKYEPFIWGPLLLASLFNLGAFYRLDALDDWECHAFRLPPIDFWCHFIWVLFAIRLSLLSKLNGWLATRLPGLARLQLSKNFFLAYALQYVMGMIIAMMIGSYLRANPLVFTLVGLAMLPLAELLAYLGARTGARKVFKGS